MPGPLSARCAQHLGFEHHLTLSNRSDWVCGLEDFPRTISQNTQTQGQGVSQSAELLHRLGGELEHGQTAMDYEISAASLKRLRGWK